MTAQTKDDTDHTLRALRSLLRNVRCSLSSERLAQDRIEKHLLDMGIPYEREWTLGPGEKIDFFLSRSGVGLEVKVTKKWSRREVARQCERYLATDSLKGLLLVTGKAQALPETLSGKPVRVLYLAESLL